MTVIILRSRLKCHFDFLVIDDVCFILRVSFTGPFEKSLQLSLMSASRMEQGYMKREIEREFEAVYRITGIQRGKEIRREGYFVGWPGGRSTAPRPVDPLET